MYGAEKRSIRIVSQLWSVWLCPILRLMVAVGAFLLSLTLMSASLVEQSYAVTNAHIVDTSLRQSVLSTSVPTPTEILLHAAPTADAPFPFQQQLSQTPWGGTMLTALCCVGLIVLTGMILLVTLRLIGVDKRAN